MQFLLLVYIDASLLDAMPPGDYERTLNRCFNHAESLKAQGKLLDYQRLERPANARTLRVRDGRSTVLDGPFAETKEMLAGFNLVEAADHDEAVRMAHDFTWAEYGSIEVRALKDTEADRRHVAAFVAAESE